MKRLLVFPLLAIFGCVPTQQDVLPANGTVPAPVASTVQESDSDACERNGGQSLQVEFLNTSGGGTTNGLCYMPDTEKERQANLAQYRFKTSCEKAGGEITRDGNLESFCTPVTYERTQQCSTSADCEGSCVKDEMFELGGFCGPKLPLAGCFTEAGTNPPKKICAE